MSARRTSARWARAVALVAALAAAAALATACGDDDEDGGADGGTTTTGPERRTVTLVTHDSFALSDDVLDAFTARTGIEIEIQRGGDAGTMLNQVILTKDDPLGDVVFGVDNTLLSRALAEDLFVPYEADGLDHVPGALQLDEQHRVTPIDYGDVCLNYDKAWFADEGVAPPESLRNLVEPAYRDLTVVENPATSSPGLAFLLATVAEYGEPVEAGSPEPTGWQGYWELLRDNGVLVVDGWEEAYQAEFTAGGGGGDRPIVVSYASSPPADIVYADPPKDTSNIGVVEASCFRQVEFAGILRGTDDEEAAGEVVDFLLSEAVQADVPLQMFVFPARDDVALPDVFVEWAATPDEPLEIAPDVIDVNRERWIDEWTDLVIR